MVDCLHTSSHKDDEDDDNDQYNPANREDGKRMTGKVQKHKGEQDNNLHQRIPDRVQQLFPIKNNPGSAKQVFACS